MVNLDNERLQKRNISWRKILTGHLSVRFELTKTSYYVEGFPLFEIRFSHWIVRLRAVNIRLWFGQSSCQRHTSWQLVKVMTIIQWENRISKGEIPLRNMTSPSVEPLRGDVESSFFTKKCFIFEDVHCPN